MTIPDSFVSCCANCRVPLAQFYCSRFQLSSNVPRTSKLGKETTLFEILSHAFKLRKPEVVKHGKSSVHELELELCRYCTRNFTSLTNTYQTILTVANETGSAFSKLIVQSKGRPGRPSKRHSVDAGLSASQTKLVESEEVAEVAGDFHDQASDNDEAPFGLQYLGLQRTKKRPLESSAENEVRERPKRKRREVTGSGNLNIDLLFPEICLGDSDYETPEPIPPANEENLITGEIDLPPDFVSAKCRYCEKTFRHPERLQKHLKSHHESKDLMEGSSSGRKDKDVPKKVAKNNNKFKTISLISKRGRPQKVTLKMITSNMKITSIPGAGGKERVKKIKGDKEKAKKKQDPLECKVCKKQFSHVQFLNQHMKSHGNEKRCPECDKKFKSPSLLKRHMQVHKKNNSDANNSCFKCEDCGREFPNLLGLQVHAVSHTRTLYTCKGCKRKFKIEKNYNQHLETARCTEKKHPCPTCGKLFKNKDKVKRHLISMHAETKPFVCGLCSKGFRCQADLNFHEVNAHICGEAKQYQCDQCGKRFKSLETLKSHEMYSHKMEKKHFCSTCGKGFPLLATLKIHEVSHSTDRPYMCTYCGRTYKHANDLKSHEVVHYKDEEKPFECPICASRYHRKDVLRLHQAREKHYGPDVPTPHQQTTTTKKLNPSSSSSKGSINLKIPLDLELNGLGESGDSSDLSSVSCSTPVVLEPQAGPSGLSVIQSVASHTATVNHGFPQLNPVILPPALSNPTHHLAPLVHPGSQPSAQLLNNNALAQASFPSVNEAISDFYRIMYDLN